MQQVTLPRLTGLPTERLALIAALRIPQGKRTLLVSLLLQWARDSGAFEDEHGESVYLRTEKLAGRFRAWVEDDANGIEWTGGIVGKDDVNGALRWMLDRQSKMGAPA